jgi:hypothetical protein
MEEREVGKDSSSWGPRFIILREIHAGKMREARNAEEA